MSEDGPVFTDSDLADLRQAKSRLECPGLTARIADLVGRPLEAGFKLLPPGVSDRIGETVRAALLKGLDAAVLTLGKGDARASRDLLHKILVAGSGVAGGAAGLASLPVELPISTALMLRSIGDIARSEGHDLSRPDVRLACLEVLALGGRRGGDDGTDSGYWIVRTALARAVSEAAAYLAERGLAEEGARPLRGETAREDVRRRRRQGRVRAAARLTAPCGTPEYESTPVPISEEDGAIAIRDLLAHYHSDRQAMGLPLPEPWSGPTAPTSRSAMTSSRLHSIFRPSTASSASVSTSTTPSGPIRRWPIARPPT
jgi:hypothetical protein